MEKTQVPQFCPAPVRSHTSGMLRAPCSQASVMSRDDTTPQWQTIMYLG